MGGYSRYIDGAPLLSVSSWRFCALIRTADNRAQFPTTCQSAMHRRQSLGAKPTRTPLHYDYHDNMYYVIQGKNENTYI